MRKTTITAIILAATACVSHAALTSVSLTAGGSSAQLSGSYSIGLTLNDPFTYNPNNDYTVLATPRPDQGGSAGALGVLGFHGNNSTPHYAQYTFAPIVTNVGETTAFVVDLWGRADPTIVALRDNDFSITLYNGAYVVGNIVGTAQTGLSIPDSDPYYLRTTFTLTAGTTFDRFEIRDTNTPYFTIAETRAAFETILVPEPSTALLGCFGVFALLHRRR